MNKSLNSHLEKNKIQWSAGHVVFALLISGLSLFGAVGIMRFVESIPDQMKGNYELFISVAIGILYLVSVYPIDITSYGLQKVGFKKTIAWGLVGGIILSIINFPYRGFVKGAAWDEFDQFIASNPGSFSIGLFLVFSIVILPVLEEIFFRGCIYRILKNSINPFWSAVITSSLFTLGHYDMVFFLYSLLLIGILELSGYLGSSILAHVLWNASWYISILIFKV